MEKSKNKVTLGAQCGELTIIRKFDDCVNGDQYVLTQCTCGTKMIVRTVDWGLLTKCYRCMNKEAYKLKHPSVCKTCGKPIPSNVKPRYCSVTCRILDKHNSEEVDGCLFYRGDNPIASAYRTCRVNGEYQPIKDVLWEEAHGRIPDGYKVVHSCGNPMCVNPLHFILVKDNPIPDNVTYSDDEQHYHQQHDTTREFFLSSFVTNNGRVRLTSAMNYFGMSELRISTLKKRLGLQNYSFIIGKSSKAESDLFEWIPTETKIWHDRKILCGKELDIVLPIQKLAIEYDGLYYHSTASGKDKNYHVNKLDNTTTQGYQLFNIFEKIDDLDIWKSMILNKLRQSRRIYARKCEVRRVDYHDIREFLAENHLQGAVTSPINYALYYEGELVEVMTFKRPRFTKDYDFELLRLCTKKGSTVVGGASKLFSAFRREYPTASVISYANRRWSRGDVYRQLGFDLLKVSAPNYWYVRGDEVISRYQAQKHKLPQLLGEGFDPELSESENMLRAGFERIYDCGNLVFGFTS